MGNQECCTSQNIQNNDIFTSPNMISLHDINKLNNDQKIQAYKNNLKELQKEINNLIKKSKQGSTEEKQAYIKHIGLLELQKQELIQLQENIFKDIDQNYDQQESLLDRIGGQHSVGVLVNELYNRIDVDKNLQKFFKGINMRKQRNQVINFLIEQFGGPKLYKGKDMVSAHEGLGISNTDFDNMTQIIVDILNSSTVGQQENIEIQQFWEQQRILVVAQNKFDKNDDSEEQKQKFQKKDKIKLSGINIFEKIGGSNTVHEIIEFLFIKLEKEKDLWFLFEKIEVKIVKQHMKEYLGQVLGGPNKYKGKDMKTAHRKLKLNSQNYDKFIKFFFESVKQKKIEQAIIEEIKYLLNPLKYEIVTFLNESIYTKIGGKEGVEILISQFLKNLESDDKIKRFFKTTDMEHLQIQMVNFLSDQFGSDMLFNGKDLWKIHQELKINEEDFNIFVQLYIDTLIKKEIDQITIEDLKQLLESKKHQIVFDGSIIGRLGGTQELRNIVNIYIDKITQHKELQKFFQGANLIKLKVHYFKFFQFVLGGQNEYKGRDLKTTHINLRINDVQFDQALEVLELILMDLQIQRICIKEIIDKMLQFKQIIVDPLSNNKKKSQIIKERTLMIKIGGIPAIGSLVDILYDKINQDGQFSKIFSQVSQNKMRKSMKVFLIQQFGGDKGYRGKDMKIAHKGVQITESIYNQFLELIFQCLQEIGVTDPTIKEEINKTLLKQKIEIVNTLDPTMTLLEQMGGQNVLKIIIDESIDLIRKDQKTMQLFQQLSQEKIIHIKNEFLQYMVYKLNNQEYKMQKGLQDVHKNLKISKQQFDAYCLNLIAVMKEQNLHTGLIRGIGKIIEETRSLIQNIQ